MILHDTTSSIHYITLHHTNLFPFFESPSSPRHGKKSPVKLTAACKTRQKAWRPQRSWEERGNGRLRWEKKEDVPYSMPLYKHIQYHYSIYLSIYIYIIMMIYKTYNIIYILYIYNIIWHSGAFRILVCIYIYIHYTTYTRPSDK